MATIIAILSRCTASGGDCGAIPPAAQSRAILPEKIARTRVGWNCGGCCVMNQFVKEWYFLAYPDDASGAETIDPEATFAGCFNCLDDYGDIYFYLGGVDSYIRERVFARLAELIGEDYGYIYSQWMKCHTHSPIFDKNGNFTGYFSESGTGWRIPVADIEKRYNAYNL